MPEGNIALYQYFIRPVSSYCLKSLNQSDHQVDLGLNQASCLNQACKIVGCVWNIKRKDHTIFLHHGEEN